MISSNSFESPPNVAPQQRASNVRPNQRATDAVDAVVGDLLGVNRTDGHCLDILDQRDRMRTAPMLERYDDDQLRLLIDFNELGREAQDKHAERLRERLRSKGRVKPE